jgi:hypothetical protein
MVRSAVEDKNAPVIRQPLTFLVDAFVQTCPKCGRRSRRQVLSRKMLDKNVIDTSRRVWARRGLWSYDENATVTIETYRYTRKCRVCGHEWTELKTSQHSW